MLVLLCDRHYLGDLGFSNLIAEYAANSLPFRMHFQHHLGSARALHPEDGFKNIDNELHRRVVIVDQQYAIQRRRLHFGPRFFDSEVVAVVLLNVSGFFAHSIGSSRLPGQ